jgi:hypothetical protein
MRRMRRLLTPANAIACLALFIALGGTGWAGEVIGHGAVGTAQLKTAAVTPLKLAPAAVTRSKIAKGAVGKDAIAAGSIEADKLVPGVVGGVAGAKISTVTTPAGVPGNSTGTVVTATCPSGQKASGGGWSSGLDAFALYEGPTADGTGWTASFASDSVGASVSVSAICIAP